MGNIYSDQFPRQLNLPVNISHYGFELAHSGYSRYLKHNGIISVKDPLIGAKGNGIIDDTAAIQKAVNEAQNGTSIYFPNGDYLHDGSINFAKEGVRYFGNGVASILHCTGATNCFTIDGGIAGMNNITLEKLLIKGNAASLHGIFIDKTHRITIRDVRVTDTTLAALKTKFSVFGLVENFCVTANEGIFVTTPTNGIILGDGILADTTTAYTIINPRIEFLSGTGIVLQNAFTNLIQGGSSENNNRNLQITDRSYDNKIIAIDLEGSIIETALISGSHNEFYGVFYDNGSNKAMHFDATSTVNKVYGGTFERVTIDAGAIGNGFYNCRIFDTFTDNGTNTEMLNVYSNFLGQYLTNRIQQETRILGVSRPYTDASADDVGTIRLIIATGANPESLAFGVHTGDYSWIQAVKAATGFRQLYINPNGGDIYCGDDILALTDNSNYLGAKNNAWKGIKFKDQTNGHWYTLDINNGAVRITDLGV